MPHVTFIYPCVGRSPGRKYIRSWQMQPLAIGVLYALTPDRWIKAFFDDRLEGIDYDQPTDLVAISIETFTAKRGYQIAREYRRRGVPAVMGGYHATFCPDEVLEHADAVCVGEAEQIWEGILRDAERGEMHGKYTASDSAACYPMTPDRLIFAGKNYFKIALVETSRGCHFHCSFCAITAFHKGKRNHRPVQDVVEEIAGLKEKSIFLVDDNIISDTKRAKTLFAALRSMKKKWVGQASINIAEDSDLLDLLAESGCVGLLIGFESLNADSLAYIGKHVNQKTDYKYALAQLRKRGIAVYGTFLLGLPSDSVRTAEEIVRFATREKIFIAAFNHIVPFPGTPLYAQLETSQRLLYDKWWLSNTYRFGEIPFTPESSLPEQVQGWCHAARQRFFSISSILRRSTDMAANCRSLRKGILFLGLNLLLRREVARKRGLPLGERL
jgi:radical SAM superfamily enzyme YgiQ (UPF0313 family)